MARKLLTGRKSAGEPDGESLAQFQSVQNLATARAGPPEEDFYSNGWALTKLRPQNVLGTPGHSPRKSYAGATEFDEMSFVTAQGLLASARDRVVVDLEDSEEEAVLE